MSSQTPSVFRVLDANCNRLREALRVIEEHYRFIAPLEDAAIALKEKRHELVEIENQLGRRQLLESRDVGSDFFAEHTRPEEMKRDGSGSLVSANFKRAQEAARVIEEYSKLTDSAAVSAKAKLLRFGLYQLEQRFCTGTYGKKEKGK